MSVPVIGIHQVGMLTPSLPQPTSNLLESLSLSSFEARIQNKWVCSLQTLQRKADIVLIFKVKSQLCVLGRK